ncbi:MAG: sugar phosphate isomerase/epimerase [Verrucomicrobia bacterium]|nr:sugar phosphate isomerase/epimerase [Verrucomicrobiota bacterium]
MPPTLEPTLTRDVPSLPTGRSVVVATPAIGAALVRERGQADFVPIVAGAGADGIEIRRELLVETRDLPRLPALGDAIKTHGLFAVYSAPIELFAANRELNLAEVERVFAEAAQLHAHLVKLPLGHFGGGLEALHTFLKRHADAGRLLVENDQTAYGGTLAPVRAFFSACRDAGLAVGMTFDVGNWTWTGENAQTAASALAPFVEYVHLKTGQRAGDAWVAVPVADDDPNWRQVLAVFAPDLPLGIEYPITGDNLTDATRAQVSRLKATSQISKKHVTSHES